MKSKTLKQLLTYFKRIIRYITL